MRRRLLVLGAAGVAGAVGVGTAARALAAQVTRVRRTRRYRHRIVSVEAETVVFARDEETVRPGTYGMDWPGGHGVIGEVVAESATTVSRALVRTERGELVAGVVDFGHLHEGDPKRALGLEFNEIRVEVEIGAVPVWEVPGRVDRVVLLLHGYRGTRASGLSFVPMLVDLGFTVLIPSYRNDPDAPPGRDRRYHLGASEWEEVAATIAYARERGATQVVLFGWSMGAAIALQAYARLSSTGLVAALVFDSPVLDWHAVLMHQARLRNVPRPLMSLALRRVGRETALEYGAFDWVARADELDVPVLIFHSSGDPTVPVESSRALARRRPDLVSLVDLEVAGHVGSWNVDAEAYEKRVRAFLVDQLGIAEEPRVE